MAGLEGVELFAPTLAGTITGLLVSLALSMVIAAVYHITYHGPGYARNYLTSLVLLSLITTLVIMVIGNNLARAFGLVGALSIIRFRTAVKDTIDIVHIFFALAVGMAAGVGYYKLAVAGTTVISVVLLLASRSPLQVFQRPRFLLQLSGTRVALDLIDRTLSTHCASFELVNVKRSAGDEIIVSRGNPQRRRAHIIARCTDVDRWHAACATLPQRGIDLRTMDCAWGHPKDSAAWGREDHSRRFSVKRVLG